MIEKLITINSSKRFKYLNTSILNQFIILLLGLTLIGCSNLDIQKLNNKAAELMSQGDIDGAIARLESIQDLNPNFPQTNYNLGIAYKEKDDLDKSIHYLERSVELKPSFYQAQLTLSIVYEELSDRIIQEEIDKFEKDNKNSVSSIDDIEFSSEQRKKLYDYYSKAKDNLDAYLKNAPVPDNEELLTSKIKEHEKNITRFSDNVENSDTNTDTNNETEEKET